jgi:hypothetical protein
MMNQWFDYIRTHPTPGTMEEWLNYLRTHPNPGVSDLEE